MIETVKTLVLEVAQRLQQKGLKLATAESCTGGGLSYWLTSIPGSSNWFERGFVTYSNAAKIDLLMVNAETINQFGAVSEETARAMAEGALKNSLADWSIAITGIAGPDGGSVEKPVGMVWFAWASKQSATHSEVEIFSGDRQAIRLAAIAKALKQLLEEM